MSVRGFYINLDRCEERRRRTEAELRKLGSTHRYERFPAVDGRNVTEWPEVKNRAELGCYLSHLGVIRQNAGFDGWLHVIEDDIRISRFTNAALAVITSLDTFAQFDILLNCVMIKSNLHLVQKLQKVFDDSIVTTVSGDVTAIRKISAVPLDDDFFSAVSYLVNPRAIARTADLLARHLEAEPFKPIDTVFSKLARSGELSIACVVPFLVVPLLNLKLTIRDGVNLWAYSQMLVQSILFADRDVQKLRRVVSNLARTSNTSPTSELIADTYRIMINGDLNMNIVRAENRPL